MADKRIDELDAAAALAGTEPVPVYQGGTTKRSTPDAFRDRAFGSLGSLTAAGSLTGTEIVGINQGGNARRTTAQAIANLAPATPAPALGGLSDVTITGVADGEVLTYDSGTSQWINAAPVTGVTTLAALTDVTITSVTDGQVLTYDSGTGQWVNETPTGGGLTNFTESVNTSAPNATIPVCALTATNAATNVDVVISWKGPSGAFMVQIPDNTTTGGNKRGSGCIDFQSLRTAATQVASGIRAAIVAGASNTNSSTHGGILGGSSNTLSSASGAIAGGQSNTVSNSSGFCGAGLANTVSGVQAGVVCGVSNQATAQRAFVGGGGENQATGESSWIPGGFQSSTRGLFAAYSWSGARRSSNFDNQCIGLPVQGTTTNATPTIITADRSAASATNVMVLPNNSCWTGTVHITGRSSGADVYYLRLDVVGARGPNAASTTIKATNPAYTFTDAALVGVSAAVVANTTRGSLEVQVIGLAATTIDWFAHFDAGNQIVR